MSEYDSLYNRYMQEANAYAASYGIDQSTAHNGAWDAFRHAYASGAMAREYGETAAHVFGDLNEIRGDLTHNQSALQITHNPHEHWIAAWILLTESLEFDISRA